MDGTISRLGHPTALVEVMNDAREQQTFKQWGETAAGAALKPAFSEQTVWTSTSQGNEWRRTPAHTLQSLLESVAVKHPPSIPESQSWESIVQKIESAVQKDQLKVEGKMFRTYAGNVNVVKFLNGMSDMIPDEKGLSVLRGGLGFVFQEWKQRIDNKERVLETLADIPDLFSWASSIYGTFKDRSLLNLVRDLFEVLLTSLCCLTDILLRHHTGSWFSRTKKQIPSWEAEDVRRIVMNIDIGKARLQTCVQNIRDTRLQQGSKDIRANLRETQAIRKTIHGHSHQLQVIEKAVGANSEQLQAFGTGFGDMRANMDQFMRQVRELAPKILQEMIQNGLYAIFTEGTYKEGELLLNTVTCLPNSFPADIKRDTGYISLPQGPHEKQRLQDQFAYISPEDLLAILCVDPLLPIRDASQVLRQGTSMRNDALQKSGWLLVTPQFKEWMRQSNSGVLLVDGDLGGVGFGRTSPLSVLSASLATQLSANDGYTTLQFFCGMHAGLQDPFSGPRGMLRLLVTQLILYPGKPAISLDFMEAALFEAIQSQDIGGLCYLFEQLIIRSSPHDTILCIIDGISDLEFSPHWRNETLQVFAFLRQLVKQHSASPVIKVLLTMSNRSGSGLRGMVNDREYVSLLSGNMNLRPIQQQLGTGHDTQGSLGVPAPLQLQPSSATTFVEPGFQGFLQTTSIRPRSAGDGFQSYQS